MIASRKVGFFCEEAHALTKSEKLGNSQRDFFASPFHMDIANNYLRRTVILHLHKFRRNHGSTAITCGSLLFIPHGKNWKLRVRKLGLLLCIITQFVFVYDRYPVNIYFWDIKIFRCVYPRLCNGIMTIFINIVVICCTFYAKSNNGVMPEIATQLCSISAIDLSLHSVNRFWDKFLDQKSLDTDREISYQFYYWADAATRQ